MNERVVALRCTVWRDDRVNGFSQVGDNVAESGGMIATSNSLKQLFLASFAVPGIAYFLRTLSNQSVSPASTSASS